MITEDGYGSNWLHKIRWSQSINQQKNSEDWVFHNIYDKTKIINEVHHKDQL